MSVASACRSRERRSIARPKPSTGVRSARDAIISGHKAFSGKPAPKQQLSAPRIANRHVGAVKSAVVAGAGNDRKLRNVVYKRDDMKTQKTEMEEETAGLISGRKKLGVGDAVTVGQLGGVSCHSKMQEKLAVLEGRVKKISLDVKETKETFDLNNSVSAREMLSDIQDKIMGIKKAMNRVRVVSSEGEKGDCCSEVTNKSSAMEKKMQELEERGPRIPVSVSSSLFVKSQIPGCCGDGEVQETDGDVDTKDGDALCSGNENGGEIVLTTNERLDEFLDQENRTVIATGLEIEDASTYQVHEIGSKCSTGGWFVLEGESVLLAHDDGSCSFYDMVNCEEKAVYRPPSTVSRSIWRDCWVIRAPTADGCAGRYVVAASAGNATDSGFCSWDFYTKDVQAFYTENGGGGGGKDTPRTVLTSLPTPAAHRRYSLSAQPAVGQWWYSPCGALMAATMSCRRSVKIFDIRDMEMIMRWEVQKPVSSMDHSSPLQWKNRGNIVVAETDAISLWDVNSLSARSVSSVSFPGRKLSALHVINADAEPGGGVRQRAASAEAEGNDGVFCTTDSINVLDFRHPSGIGLRIPKLGTTVHSLFAHCDTVFLGCTNARQAGKKQACSQLQQVSLRKQKLVSAFSLPEPNAHSRLTQVWGNSSISMGVCEGGLHVFDAVAETTLKSMMDNSLQKAKDVIGPDDMSSPTFDYSAPRALIISRDRPAIWKHLRGC